jgi:hypothetical protein
MIRLSFFDGVDRVAAGMWRGTVGLVVVLGLANCGSQGGATPSPSGGASSSTKAVPAVDACKVLSAQDFASVGLPAQGQARTNDGEVGCSYDGQRYIVKLMVDPTRTVDGYLAGASNYLTDRQNAVNGRRGALVQSVDAKNGCTQFMELGGGVFVVRMTYGYGQTSDPCGDTERIARVVEPKLPK